MHVSQAFRQNNEIPVTINLQKERVILTHSCEVLVDDWVVPLLLDLWHSSM
jgi:hypothetical protein